MSPNSTMFHATPSFTRLFRSPLVWLVVAMRLSGIALILVNPLFGMAASFIFDWLDAYLLIQRVGYRQEEYHYLDKNIDQVWSLVMLGVGAKTEYRSFLFFLYLYRLVGHFIFLKIHTPTTFVLFPNFFEPAFVWLVALGPWSGNLLRQTSNMVLVALFAAKILQEVGLHVFWPRYLPQLKRRGYPPILRSLGWNNPGI